MTESTPAASVADIATMREAARLIRERANAAFMPWRPWSDKRLPERSSVEEWQDDMKGYLGGTWGEHAAAWSPPVALAVADWLDGEAATRGELEPFTDLLNAAISTAGGPESLIRFGRDARGEIAMVTDTTSAALAFARAYLGEQRDGSNREVADHA